ncbi:SurA N-terminal domain-containing protein [Mucilaginibacter gynuensis]|uniref:Periplasmic chaperone PpiD n=2 Tax=Mucilaginibacter gynuensis TaxID=1302236 RepID=A0ABP8GWP9_9SPHI
MGMILVIVIAVALLAFIAGEVIHFGGSLLRGDANTIGVVAGEKIPYADFNKKVEQNTDQYRQQYGANLSPQITSYIQENTWNQLLSQAILKKELDRLSLVVGTAETQDMISGKNPDQQIIQAFGDPQTGQVDRVKLNNVLNNIKAAKEGDPMKSQWNAFVAQMIESKKAQKYVSLVTNGLYVNSLEAQDDYEAKNKLVNFKYVALAYASIPDSKVTITDGDYSDFYNEHKASFKTDQELRNIEYVTFNGAASKADSAAVKAQVEKMLPDFKASTNDSLYVQVNSETKTPLVYQKKGALEPAVDSVMFSAAKGFVYGPYLSNGSYKLAKLVDSRVGPDSVKASHILINPATEGGVEKALAKADSLKKLIVAGKSFADLATIYSIDKQSAEKGGDLGTFGRGTMVPVFDEAVFNGTKGEYKIVTSQFGVHLIKIVDQKGSSKVAKIAIVDKPLIPSKETQSAAYNKAQAFLASVSGGNFDAEVKKEKLQLTPANDVSGITASLPGLESARDLVRWAFKAESGDVSDQVFTSGDQYVVAHLTTIKPEGTLPLEVVKPQIEAAVRNKVKAKQLLEKIQSASASSIDQLGQKVGAPVVPVQNIVFANPVIPGVGAEYSLVGSIFGSQPNKLSKGVEGQNGVYAYVVESFVKPAALANTVREKQQIGQNLTQRASGQLLNALKDKANVKDYRAKFL